MCQGGLFFLIWCKFCFLAGLLCSLVSQLRVTAFTCPRLGSLTLAPKGRSSPKTPAQLSEAFPKPGLSLCWSHRVHPQQVKVGEWSHWDNGDSDNPPPNTRAGNPMPRSYFQSRFASSRGSEKLRVNTQRSNVALNYMKLWNNSAVDTQPCQ